MASVLTEADFDVEGVCLVLLRGQLTLFHFGNGFVCLDLARCLQTNKALQESLHHLSSTQFRVRGRGA